MQHPAVPFQRTLLSHQTHWNCSLAAQRTCPAGMNNQLQSHHDNTAGLYGLLGPSRTIFGMTLSNCGNHAFHDLHMIMQCKMLPRGIMHAFGHTWHTCSTAPDRMALLMSRIDLKCGAHSGHSFSFSPKLRRLKEWPHTKWTAGSSNGVPLRAHLLF